MPYRPKSPHSPPREGGVVDRARGVRPCLASLWASTEVENRSKSSAGTTGKAFRSEDGGDVPISAAR